MTTSTDNFYQSDAVNFEKVIFKNQLQMNVVGNLFTPKYAEKGANLPALVIGHPMGAVKEQSATLYATKLAELGFVTLAIDS
ncbi:alpha/beta hydrolase [Pseudoalteromonas gelatinilytica]